MVRDVAPSDLTLLNRWRESYGLAAMPPWWIPEIGYVALDEAHDPIACCFLLQTDTGVAQLEFMHADPSAPYPERDRAIGDVAMACVARARELGYRLVTGTTGYARIADRAVALGWTARRTPSWFVTFDCEKEQRS